MPAVLLIDDGHLIVAKAVDVVLVDEEARVVDQELPHVLVPEREHRAGVILRSVK